MLGIDTIIITLHHHEFAILRPWEFTPNSNRIIKLEPQDMGKGKYMQATRNPSKKDTQIAGYLPCITLYKALRSNGLVVELRIQFSAPKLVYGNNFDELLETDFIIVRQKLFAGLKYYGIQLFKGIDTLDNARVSTIHFAKNFPLDNLMTAHEAVKEIKKCDVNSWRDVSQSDYVNNGHGFKTHSKYYELAFYDKFAEYTKSLRNQPVFDKDIQLQLNLFGDNLAQYHQDILRMEARLNNARAIQSVLKKSGFEGNAVTLSSLCQKDLSQAVLKQQLDEMYSRYPIISNSTADEPFSLFSELYVKNPNKSITTILSAIGAKYLYQELGTRELKDIVGPRGSKALLRQTNKINTELEYRSEKPEIFQL
jgi:hypothetical protein